VSRAILLFVVVALVISVAGGAIGNAFGLGFLGSPISHIQLPAEPIMATPFVEVDNALIGDITITNTMVATWATIILLVTISFIVSRKVSAVPGRLQGLIEMVFEFFLGLSDSIAGKDARRFFPLVMTIFLFIVINNWLGILPGFGTIGWIESPENVIHHQEVAAEKDGTHVDLHSVHLQVFEGDGSIVFLPPGSVDNETTAEEFEQHPEKFTGQTPGLLVPYLRSANSDINTTLALALVAMFMIHWWGLRTLGIFGHVGKFINFKEGPIMLFVGLLEIVGEAARIISFTFRLFGNIFAGEVLLVAMAFLLPVIGIIPFLGLELFVGFIQATIFAVLTLVFAATAVASHGGGEEHH
jgi:F-type H+-transporting ATPase subunit a